MAGTHIVISGAGIIGLTLALELRTRGFFVTVLERDRALAHASSAAAGMLAVEDPHNPPALLPLSRYSSSLYPAYLGQIEGLSGIRVPIQTDRTVQHLEDGSAVILGELSIDPRQLGPALLKAVVASGARVIEGAEFAGGSLPEGVESVVHATGAWFDQGGRVFPRKGQMARVRLPAGLDLREVHRGEHAYVVPRTSGPQAGTALVGATVEDAGFDLSTSVSDLQGLRKFVSEWLPELASEASAPTVETWAGMRPATRDALPLLGELPGKSEWPGVRQFAAAGHFRNGILLAPATAHVIADLIEGKAPAVDLSAYSPDR